MVINVEPQFGDAFFVTIGIPCFLVYHDLSPLVTEIFMRSSRGRTVC